jgi:hypothetical protein
MVAAAVEAVDTVPVGVHSDISSSGGGGLCSGGHDAVVLSWFLALRSWGLVGWLQAM